MLSNLNYLLVTATCIVSICTAIRVDWNTNTGPIIPPTPRTTVRPVPPFREPAPVWEDLSNDIPNPNPYVYVPPPPSRPKSRLNTNINYNYNNNNNYGRIITSQPTSTYPREVSSLSPQYIPNVGTRYVAVVPTSTTTKAYSTTLKYTPAPAANAISSEDKNSYKLQGKYNVKTKKYKAYEKVKYVPVNYQNSSKPSVNTTDAQALIPLKQQQKLPEVSVKHEWSSPFISNNNSNITTTTTTTTTTMMPLKTSKPTKAHSKQVQVKDMTTIKPQDKLNHSVDKAKKS